MEVSFGVDEFVVPAFNGSWVVVWVLDVDAAGGVNETLPIDSRSVGARQHIAGQRDGLAVFSLAR